MNYNNIKKAKLKYVEYLNGIKNEEYICICEVKDSEEELNIITKNFKKDNMYLRVLKNNDIICVEKKGNFSYLVSHKKNLVETIKIDINSNGVKSKIDSTIKTNIVKYKELNDMYNILIEFETNENIVKCIYEISKRK